MVILSFVCALILSVLASALKEPKEIAKELDRSKQMMIAAKILSHEGNFILPNDKGVYQPAKLDDKGFLVPTDQIVIPTQKQLIDVYSKRLIPLMTNDKGEVKTPQELNIDLTKYDADFRKTGFYKEPWKLFYQIMPNSDSKTPIGYVIPVNGYGLWDAIYGYIALKPDMDTVIGISWYDQKETPGLGANIAEAAWQNQFPGKKIFQESPGGTTDFKSAPLGITVVKGKVAEVLGSSPKAKSAVDGMAGATLTGNGVTEAYKDVFAGYRPFLLKYHEKQSKNEAAS